MQRDILNRMLTLFDSPEKWEAFIEMVNQKGAITNHFLSRPLNLLLTKLRDDPESDWICDLDPTDKTAVICYLRDFGPGSLMLKIAWNYEFHLLVMDRETFDTNKIDNLLKSEYSRLLAAFDRIDRSFEPQTKAMEFRNYSFGSKYDSYFGSEVDQFAWYAGNKTDELVDQIIDKVNRFRKDPELTKMLRAVNEKAKIVR